MFEKLIGVEERFIEVEKHLSDPKIVNDRNIYQNYVREHAELNKVRNSLSKIKTDAVRSLMKARVC